MSGQTYAEGAQMTQAALGWPGIDLKGQPCNNPTRPGQGPYNYNNSSHRQQYLPRVEASHFTKEIEGLSKSDPHDIVYTLRAFPNHIRALYSMMRFELKNPRGAKAESEWPAAECSLQRAIKFDPSNAKLYLLYGNYLKKKKKPELAIKQYQDAISTNPNIPDLRLALGHLYFDLKRYNDAVEQAKLARDQGSKNMKLYRKLKAAGKWPNS